MKIKEDASSPVAGDLLEAKTLLGKAFYGPLAVVGLVDNAGPKTMQMGGAIISIATAVLGNSVGRGRAEAGKPALFEAGIVKVG